MEHSSIAEVSAERRKVSRPAYKTHAAKWKAIAFMFMTAWAFTTGLLLWNMHKPVEIIKVISPSSYNGGK